MTRLLGRLIERIKADIEQSDRQAKCDHAEAADAPGLVCPKCKLDLDPHLSW